MKMKMKMNQFAVIGLGRFGSNLAKELMHQGYQVMGIDANEDIIEDIGNHLTYAVVADSTDEEILRSLGIRNMDCVIVAIGDDIQANIMTTILLKELQVPMVVAKAITELHERVLQKIGIEKVIRPERDMAEIRVPEKLNGWSLKKLNARAKFGCSIVAIHKRHDIIISPGAEALLEQDDVMIVIGGHKQMERFEHEVIVPEGG